MKYSNEDLQDCFEENENGCVTGISTFQVKGKKFHVTVLSDYHSNFTDMIIQPNVKIIGQSINTKESLKLILQFIKKYNDFDFSEKEYFLLIDDMLA